MDGADAEETVRRKILEERGYWGQATRCEMDSEEGITLEFVMSSSSCLSRLA